MAVRLIALYNQPDDPAAFDAHYRDVHAPMVRRYPGLRDLRNFATAGVTLLVVDDDAAWPSA